MLPHAREMCLSGDGSDTEETKKNEEEVEVETSGQNLSNSADSALRSSPAQLDYAGQPMQAGEPYRGRP